MRSVLCNQHLVMAEHTAHIVKVMICLPALHYLSNPVLGMILFHLCLFILFQMTWKV